MPFVVSAEAGGWEIDCVVMEAKSGSLAIEERGAVGISAALSPVRVLRKNTYTDIRAGGEWPISMRTGGPSVMRRTAGLPGHHW